MKIYLIGMPGSGKSTLGRQAANKLLIPFIDLDTEIEKVEGCSIPELFSKKGEDYFRQKEAQVLRQFASGSDSFIMATGGGAPCFYDGMNAMNDTGITIFLDVSVNSLVDRLSKNTDRPLLANEGTAELMNKLSKLMEKRLAIYSKASKTIHNPDLDKLLNALAVRM